jgi:hypothetical protein
MVEIVSEMTLHKSQGCSVVDYYLVGHDDLYMYSDFKVVRSSDL